MICIKPDEFIEEKVRWIADLSNGISVYQDDNREGCIEPIAWKRLKQYIKSEKVFIINLHLQFRSNIINVFNGIETDGYFFGNKIVQFLGGGSLNFFIVGYIKSNLIYRKTFKVPELVLADEDVIKEHTVPEDFLIRN